MGYFLNIFLLTGDRNYKKLSYKLFGQSIEIAEQSEIKNNRMKTNNPQKFDYKDGYKHTLNNSIRLFDSAVLLAEKKKYYSVANSLLILSAEEAIKAFSLFHSYLFPNPPIENFEQLFFKHQFKHELTKSIILFAGIVEGLIKNDLTDFNIDTEIEWLEKANNSKNNGLYVGLDLKTGKLSLPEAINIKEYNISKTHVERIIQIVARAKQVKIPNNILSLFRKKQEEIIAKFKKI